MRILYFYQYFTTPAGSWSTRCYEFSRRWVARGDEVVVITSVYDKSDLRPDRWLSTQMIDGIEVRAINLRLSNKHGTIARLATFLVYAWFASWYALTLRADVILASSGPITVGLPGLVARYVRRIPMVFEVRDLWPEGAVQLGVLRNSLFVGLARWFEAQCYGAADRIVALSEGMAESIRASEPGRPVSVVPNAADLDMFGPQTLGGRTAVRDPGLVVYAGTLGLMDDCSQIIAAAEILQRRGRSTIRLVLLGDGKERPSLELRARPLKNVAFLGLRPKREVADWLSRASCALVTFRDVPVMGTVSPNKLFDALAAGVPVIQTTRGWIRDMLSAEHCGISVDPGDASALADQIERLVDDPGLRDEMGRQARSLAERKFGRDALAASMHSVLKEAAASRSRDSR